MVSREAKAFKRECALIAKYAGQKEPFIGPVALSVNLHPKRTKSGLASKVRIDLDNALKVVIDALNGIVYTDDRNIEQLSARLSIPLENGKTIVRVEKISNGE